MIKWNYIEGLFGFCSLPERDINIIRDRIEYIESNWNEFTEMEYYDIINKLRNNQLDKISNGLSYNQTEILNHLKKLS